jgi:hypothetical protein
MGLLVSFWVAWAPALLSAQVVGDNFEDGDFLHNPPWMGSVDRFVVVREEAGYRLRTRGQNRADTIQLLLRSPIAYGRWSCWIRISGVNLSTANGLRWYLLADRADLKGPVRGYYVQIGTTNSDDVRLIRQDGDRRIELLRTPALGTGTEHLFLFHVERRLNGTWYLEVNGIRYGPVQDTLIGYSRYLGFWVKHSATAGSAYAFDDLEAVWGDGPDPDRRPFAVIGAQVMAPDVFRLRYSHPLDSASATRRGAYRIDPGSLEPLEVWLEEDPRDVLLRLPLQLRSGLSYRVRISGVRDWTGRTLEEGEAELRYWDPNDAHPGLLRITEILYDPLPGGAEYIELYHTGDRPLLLSGWSWHRRPDSRGKVVAYPISPEPVVLEPGRFLVLTTDTATHWEESRLVRLFGKPDPRQAVFLIRPGLNLGLSDEGDAVVIRRPDGTLIDSVYYRPEWHHPAVYDPRGRSLERRDLSRPSIDPSNWTTSADPMGGTPGRPNSVRPPEASEGGRFLWIEPNPFSPDGDSWQEEALIRYRLRRDEPAFVRVRIFDQRGRLVRELVPAGTYAPAEGYWVWDGYAEGRRPLATGPYIVLLEATYGDPVRTETHRALVVLVRGRGN